MLSNEQANQIGSELIEKARVERREKNNANAPRVPLLYRFSELQAFERRERPEVLQEARKATTRKPALNAVRLFSLTLAIIAIFFAVKLNLLGTLSPIVYWISAEVLMFPVFFYHRLLMRRHIRARVLARHGNDESLTPMTQMTIQPSL